MTPDTTASPWRTLGRVGAITLLALLDLRIIINALAGQRYLGIAQVTFGWALMLVMGIVAFAYVQVMSWRMERELRAALNGDMFATPPASAQPDPALALQPGETLTLTRVARHGFWSAFLTLPWAAPLVFAMIAGFGEFYMYLAAPDSLGWLAAYMSGPTSMRYPIPPANTSLIDWGVYLLPLAAATIGAVALTWQTLSERRQEITASDAGVMIQRALRRRRFIPWEDIQLILASGDGSDDTDYWLRGRRLRATLALATVTPAAKPDDKPYHLPYRFGAGSDAYRAVGGDTHRALPHPRSPLAALTTHGPPGACDPRLRRDAKPGAGGFTASCGA